MAATNDEFTFYNGTNDVPELADPSFDMSTWAGDPFFAEQNELVTGVPAEEYPINNNYATYTDPSQDPSILQFQHVPQVADGAVSPYTEATPPALSLPPLTYPSLPTLPTLPTVQSSNLPSQGTSTSFTKLQQRVTSPAPSQDTLSDDSDFEDSRSPFGSSKDARNAAERRRRAKLKDTMSEIKNLVPTLNNDPKASKAVIFRKTADYLYQVEENNTKLKDDNEKLKAELENLRLQLQDASASSPPPTNQDSWESPLSDADVDSLIAEVDDNAHWEFVSSGYGKFGTGHEGEGVGKVTVWKKRTESTSISRVKSHILIDASPSAVFAVLYDLNKRMEWDMALMEVKVLERHNGSTDDVVYMATRSPYNLANRDYVQARRVKQLPDGSFVVICKNTIHPKFPPKKEFVRGELFLSGYVIRPDPTDPNRSYFWSVSQVDLKGKIPAAFVNFLTQRSPYAWYEGFVMATCNCLSDLVSCYKTAFLRLVIP